jgi:RNA polymerase sigma-70 factor, ECF subfamily
MDQPDPHEVARVITRAHHEEWARVVAVLTRQFGDLDVAEEATADAFETALDRWRVDGVPPNPGGWLTTTARRKALDRLRREGRRAEKQQLAFALDTARQPESVGAIDDERLRLLFICCHPALGIESRVALTLRMVGGLTVPEIARAFLVQESAMGQRISRAKSRLRSAAIPFRVPTDDDLPERLSGVLAVLYLIFNEGYFSTSSNDEPVRHDLVTDAIGLCRLLQVLLPREREVTGLLALMLLAEARRATRVSADGALIPLGEQRRDAWDHAMIAEAHRMIDGAAGPGQVPGRYLTLAEISATHVSTDDARDTDWPRVLALYDHLVLIDPSPIVLLNRAVAIAEVHGPGPAMELVDRLHDTLSGYHPFFAVRAEIARRLGRTEQAQAAYRRAIELTGNSAERDYLRRRCDELDGGAGSSSASPPASSDPCAPSVLGVTM